MSYKYYWAKDFTYLFFVPKPDAKDGFEDLLLVTEAPAIHIYMDKPTREDAIAGTGSPIESILAWGDVSDAAGNNGKSIAVSAIPEEDPESDSDRQVYYIAVNFVLEDGEDSILTLRQFLLERPGTVSSPLTVDQSSIQEIYQDVDQIASGTQQDSAIKTATSLAKISLETKGFDWAQIHEQDDLDLSIAHSALSILMTSQIRTPGDDWEVRMERYQEIGGTLLQGIKILYDNTRSGEPDQHTSKGNYLRIKR